MRQLVQSFSSKQPYKTSYPAPPSATLLYDTTTDQVLTAGISTFTADSTVNALNALPSTSLQITPLTEWSVNFGDKSLEDKIASGKIVLFTTVEPSVERRGTDPSVVDLIVALNFQRVVIGSPHPLPDLSMKAATRLHGQGLAVSVGCNALQTDALLEEYRCRVQHHLTSSGRKFRRRSGRPLGLLHCSVIKSSDEKAFERNGNAFGKSFGGQLLSERNFGAFEIAPPPRKIWADELEANWFDDYDPTSTDKDKDGADDVQLIDVYDNCDAVVVTIPRVDASPAGQMETTERLSGLFWFASQGNSLPPAVERIVVVDATDLTFLPLNSEMMTSLSPDSNVDVESFWRGVGRSPTRVILRRGRNLVAKSAAESAAALAAEAALASMAAADAAETGEAEKFAIKALEIKNAANKCLSVIQEEAEQVRLVKEKLQDLGVRVEILSGNGNKPLDVMEHLGKFSSHSVVLWRAACWGQSGVESVLSGAFSFISAHIAVTSNGGVFWQTILAENALQAALGQRNKVSIESVGSVTSQDCGNEDADSALSDECDLNSLHVVLDANVKVIDQNDTKLKKVAKFKTMSNSFDKKVLEEAPWFI